VLENDRIEIMHYIQSRSLRLDARSPMKRARLTRLPGLPTCRCMQPDPVVSKRCRCLIQNGRMVSYLAPGRNDACPILLYASHSSRPFEGWGPSSGFAGKQWFDLLARAQVVSQVVPQAEEMASDQTKPRTKQQPSRGKCPKIMRLESESSLMA
jgi:hypothetical protein